MLLHSIFGLDGPWAVVVELAAFVVIVVHVFAFLVVAESDLSRSAKWRAVALCLLPLVGPLVWLTTSPVGRRAFRTPERVDR